MTRCDSCAQETRFLSPQKDCLDCAQHDPLERAAIALFDDFKHSIGWPSKTWDDPALDDTDGRETFRRKARLALTAAINVDELAEHIGWHHAQIVRDHLLGTTHD